MKYEDIRFGFIWGPVQVSRICEDEKQGWVVLTLKTKREEIEFRVTAAGRFIVRRWRTGG